MRTYAECIPCFLRQALEAARLATDDEAVHVDLLRRVLRLAADLDLTAPPPVMSLGIHRLVRETVGDGDPYRGAKRRFNALAAELLPDMEARVAAAADPFGAAVRAAIAGNVIDLGAKSGLTEDDIRAALGRCLEAPVVGTPAALRDAARAAGRILYLTDNAGEIVFDRLLIERLPTERVTVAVRGRPILNDATRADAEAAGLADLVEVIDNGSDAPGTVLAECSETFRARFDAADLVIAKGQGNFETLSDAPRPCAFILMAKCPVIARHLGCACGDLVCRLHRPEGLP